MAIAAVAVFESSGGFLPGAVDSKAAIESSYTAHLLDVHYMNVSGIEQAFTPDASVIFVDPTQAGDNTGNFTGLQNIGNGFGAIFLYFALPTISHENYTVSVNGNQATLNSTFVIQGYDSDENFQTALVTTHVDYVRQSGTWLISFEEWNITFGPIPTGEQG